MAIYNTTMSHNSEYKHNYMTLLLGVCILYKTKHVAQMMLHIFMNNVIPYHIACIVYTGLIHCLNFYDSYEIKHGLPLYIGSLTRAWSSDAYELTTKTIRLSG